MEKDEIKILIGIICISFLIHLSFLYAHPFYSDEALYVKMISEQQGRLTLLPTYLGYETGWKPPFFFWVFAYLTKATDMISNNIEFIFKLPNILFGMLNIVLLYLIFRKFLEKEECLFAAAMYAFSTIFIYTNERLLLDTFFMCFALLSIYLYVSSAARPPLRFASAGLMLFFAIFTKSFVGLMVPIVAVAYLLQNDKKTLRNPWFILSLISIPLAFGIHYFSMPSNLANSIFLVDMGGKVATTAGTLYSTLVSSFISLLIFGNILIIGAVIGFRYRWNENWMMSAWFMLTAILLLSTGFMQWYYYAVLPAFVFFTLRAIQYDPQKKTCEKKPDIFFKAIFVAVIIVSLFVAYFWYNCGNEQAFGDAKFAGQLVAGKSDVLFVGQYHTNVVAIAYKTMAEARNSSSVRDFGWVLIPRGMVNESNDMSKVFISNYMTEAYSVEEDGMSSMFWREFIFRKRTNITDFQYVVIALGMDEHLSIPGYDNIFEGNMISVYKKGCG
ncbi:MAG: ArnT family glycosyltransferase [Candidatus Bilamarchaeaceae archaeon]